MGPDCISDFMTGFEQFSGSTSEDPTQSVVFTFIDGVSATSFLIFYKF